MFLDYESRRWANRWEPTLFFPTITKDQNSGRRGLLGLVLMAKKATRLSSTAHFGICHGDFHHWKYKSNPINMWTQQCFKLNFLERLFLLLSTTNKHCAIYDLIHFCFTNVHDRDRKWNKYTPSQPFYSLGKYRNSLPEEQVSKCRDCSLDDWRLVCLKLSDFAEVPKKKNLHLLIELWAI